MAKSRAADFLQFLLATVGGDRLHQGGGVVVVEHLDLEPPHAAVVSDHRRLAHGDVQVAGLELDDGGQQFVDLNGRCHVDSLLSVSS